MSFVNLSDLSEVERLPGWRGRHFDSLSMTFGYWEFDAGSSIHEHSHPQEEVWFVIEGELEITVGGETRTAGPGGAAIVPPGERHSVVAHTDGRALAVDHPVRADA
jgi:quercetin dioxygenase-like cupin family protein